MISKQNMPDTRKLIFISNDDGFDSNGIRCLYQWLRPLGDIVAVAPDSGRSGAACSITSSTPVTVSLRHREEGLAVYSCSGTPTDCVKLAFDHVLTRTPDLVVSGINHGDNASINVHYSGTLGVAAEGALQRVPSVAFSYCDHNPDADLSHLRPYVVKITKQALLNNMPPLTLLNVNFPQATTFRGVKICTMCHSRWLHDFRKVSVPERGDFYFLVGNWTNTDPSNTSTDSYALEHGYIAVTPTTLDVTSKELAEELSHWDIGQ